MEPTRVHGMDLYRCGLCDHLHGSAEQLAEIDLHDEAEVRGIHPDVYPLVRALEAVPTFQVVATSVGDVETSEFPFVFLRVEEGGLRHIERLLTSLEMANRSTKRRWVVECTLQRGLVFVLRPRFWKPILEIDGTDIREARADFHTLADILTRDVQLGWWHA
ncbi:MAG: hypothetical protein O2894_09520 [Planctomycetota bacterium]|nr:hypothetical protein [Planctomycetota bacterium]